MTIPGVLDCSQQRYLAGAAGFLAAVVPGVDTLLELPPVVHWAAAGAATDVICKGTVEIDGQLAMCAAGGALAGYLGKVVVNQIFS